jgi:predicted ATPase
VTRADAFVGRHDELAFLHEEFTAACDGRTRFVPIEGEAGIGKSRLVAQFTASIAGEATVSLGQCSEHVHPSGGHLQRGPVRLADVYRRWLAWFDRYLH